MASQDQQQKQVDFFTALPPELVLQIILNLLPKDLLPCMAVSRAWWNILSGMETYWRWACVQVGLVGKLLPVQSSSSKPILSAYLKHRRSICGFPPKHKQLTSGYPHNMHYVWQCSRGRKIMGALYRDFQPHAILLHRVEDDAARTVLAFPPTYSKIAENRLIWAHLHDQFLICAAASGIWSVYDVEFSQGTLLLQWRAETMYCTDIRIACCDECGMICTAKLTNGHLARPSLEVKVVELNKELTKTKQLPLPKVTKFLLEMEEFSFRQYGFAKKKIALLSRSTERGSCRLCSSHLLLIQSANNILGHVICYKMKGDRKVLNLMQTVVRRYSVPCSNCDSAITKNVGLNTEFVLSGDKSLVGMIFQASLVTWEVKSFHMLSSADILLKSYSYEEMKLISLGHIYSIVGLEFDCSIVVLATRTGQRLLRCPDITHNHCHMVSPFITFLSSVEEEWQSDTAQACQTMIMYWNKTNRSIEGVGIGVPPSTSPDTAPTKRRKKHWWHRTWEQQD